MILLTKTEFLFNDIGQQKVKNTDVHAFDLALGNLEKRVLSANSSDPTQRIQANLQL